MSRRVSELIKDLREILEKHGDVEVVAQISPQYKNDATENTDFRPVEYANIMHDFTVEPGKKVAVIEIERHRG